MAYTMLPQLSIPYFQSKLRLYEGMWSLCIQELLLLAEQLKSGAIEQCIYDDCVAAIERDIKYIRAEIAALTEVKPAGKKRLAA